MIEVFIIWVSSLLCCLQTASPTDSTFSFPIPAMTHASYPFGPTGGNSSSDVTCPGVLHSPRTLPVLCEQSLCERSFNLMPVCRLLCGRIGTKRNVFSNS